AEHLGTTVGTVAVEAYFRDSGREQINELARARRLKPSHILAAMQEYLSVQAAARAISASALPSTAEVRMVGRDLLEKVRVNAVMLPAAAFVDESGGFPEEEIEDHWSRYREAEAGEGLNFGYYVPPHLCIQYVKIDQGKIEQDVRVANLERNAKRYYDTNRMTDPAFRRPPEQMRLPPDVEGPLPILEPFLGWEEVKEAAIAAVRKQQAGEAVANLANWLSQYDAERWFDAPDTGDGYREPSEQVTRLEYYQEALERIPPTIAYREAVSVVQTDFFSQDEAGNVPDIGAAVYRPHTGPMLTFSDLAFRTKAIVPEMPSGEQIDRASFLSPFQSCPYPLVDSAGTTYLFRVVDSQPGHIAESVDEVRERVIAGLRLLHGFEAAKARAEGLRSCAPDVTLQDAYESDEALLALEAADVAFYESPALSRLKQYQIGADDPEAMTYVGGGIGAVPTEVIEQWFELEHAWEHTAVIELRDRAMVMVVEWAETQRARNSEFVEQREQIANQLGGRRLQAAITDWFDPAQIRARSGLRSGG
ncbi:MAG: hypothetical protein KJ749_06300, partial [Planctomycetes bacterium]|nr:hypothetical protein [Planctomycetota bacterium]